MIDQQSLDALRRKRDQAWELAGQARLDGDHVEETRRTAEALELVRQIGVMVREEKPTATAPLPALVIEVRHRTCALDAARRLEEALRDDPPDEEAPLMFIERVEDDAAIYTCPKCHEKMSVLLVFQKGWAT